MEETEVILNDSAGNKMFIVDSLLAINSISGINRECDDNGEDHTLIIYFNGIPSLLLYLEDESHDVLVDLVEEQHNKIRTEKEKETCQENLPASNGLHQSRRLIVPTE